MQKSTTIGGGLILSQVQVMLGPFWDIQIEEIPKALCNMTCGELIGITIPVMLGLWSIFHDEKKG